MKTSILATTRVLLSIAATVALGQPALATDGATQSGTLLPWQIAGLGDLGRVVRVVDPQTLDVTVNGVPRTVHYAGMSALAPGDCGYAQAQALNIQLMSDRLVILEPDVAGSSLVYVYRVDGPLASQELVSAGWARPDDAQPGSKHYYELVGDARTAREAGSGGWTACGWGGSAPTAVAPAGPSQQAALGAAVGQSTAATCTMLSSDALAARVDKLPQQAYLRNGDCVTVYGAADWTGAGWAGKYIYHPAGSTITLGAMYVRWFEGFVAITDNQDGTFDAHYMANNVGEVSMFGRVIHPGHDATTVATLVHDASATDVIRIPNNAWLFRDAGNGKVTTLVDSFELVSGDMRY